MLKINVWTPNGNNSHNNKSNSHFSFSHNYNYQYTRKQKPYQQHVLCNSVKLNLIRIKRKRKRDRKKIKCFVNNLFVYTVLFDIFSSSLLSFALSLFWSVCARSFFYPLSFSLFCWLNYSFYRNDMLARAFAIDSIYTINEKKRKKERQQSTRYFSFEISFSFHFFNLFVLFSVLHWSVVCWLLCGVCQTCSLAMCVCV